mmetsp:Transcript_9798/g.14167  ORF Transcript_9798/g.14167 Transcript_9798/m.14167 type:complete len:292 (-) Transcript_9798:3109-3984(-)
MPNCSNDGAPFPVPEMQFPMQQQITGRLPLEVQSSTECIYVCDDWPSWYFMREALHVICKAIFHPPTAPNLFAAQTFDSSLPLLPLTMLPSTSTSAQLVVVQGSLSLFQGLSFYSNPIMPTLFLPAMPTGLGSGSSLLPQWISIDLPHHLCGGVLDGRFPVVYNADCWSTLPISLGLSYPRSLRHIINQAAKGFHPEASPPVGDTNQPLLRRSWHIVGSPTTLDWNGLLPRHSPFLSVQCPSVSPHSKWTHRSLTPDELAAVFDVSSAGIKYFSKWPFGRRRQLPFIRSKP